MQIKEVELGRILSPISEVPGESAGVSSADDSHQLSVQQTRCKLTLGRGLWKNTGKPRNIAALQNSEAAGLHRGIDGRITQQLRSAGNGPD